MVPKQVLIVDTETTGLSPAEGELLEVAAILYSVEQQCTLQQASTLLPTRSLRNPAQAINQISIAATQATDPDLAQTICEVISRWAVQADYLVAHNASFDRQWMESHPQLGSLFDRPWLCSCHDIRWPQQHRQGQKLIDLALAHGVGVSSAHRALTDCQLIAALFDRMGNLSQLFRQALEPKVLVRALVSYDDRHLAKESGFQWDRELRHWSTWITPTEVETLPFRYEVLQPEATAQAEDEIEF
jgi:DNA polymerase III subunit epsilon